MNRFMALGLGLLIGATACQDEEAPLPDPGSGPAPVFRAKPDPVSNQRPARFVVGSPEDGDQFEVWLDGRRLYVSCPAICEVAADDGAHTIQFYARSELGDRIGAPATYRWVVDTVAPHLEITAGPSAVDNATAPAIAFRADPDATVRCALDDRPPVACTSPYQAPALAEGPHRFTVVATDAAGNATSAAVAWTLDASSSDTVIDAGPTGVVSTVETVFRFSSPDAPAGSTFRCTIDGDVVAPCGSPFTVTEWLQGEHSFAVAVVEPSGNVDPTPAVRTWTLDTVAPGLAITGGPAGATSDPTPTFTFTTSGASLVECRIAPAAFAPCSSPFTPDALPDGAATLEVRARDLAGNVATVARSFAVDTVAPSVAITAGPDGLTNDTTPTFEFTAPDATTTCTVNGQSFACSSPVTLTVASGSFTLQVRATDPAGNTATAVRAFTVDAIAPILTINDGPPSSTADPSPRFVFTASADAALTCALDGAAFAPCASPLTVGPVALGSHELVVHATDAAGNVASAWRDFFDDPRPLAVAFTSGPTGEINQRSPRFTWAATGATGVTCRYDAAAFGSCSAALATALVDGPHTFEVRASNDLGGALSATRSFTVDTVAPLATITAGPTGTVTTPSVTFELATSGAPAVTECRLQPGGPGNAPYAPCGSPVSFELTAPGPYTFEVRVRDQAGNQWSAYRDFTFAP